MTIFDMENWINPVQYSITAEADEGEGGENQLENQETEQQAEGQEAPQEADEGEGGEEKPQRKAWYTERIDKLTFQKNEAETRAQTLSQQNQQLKSYIEALLSAGATPQQAAAAAGAAAEGMTDAGNAGAGRAASGDPRGRLFNQSEIDQMIEARVNERLQQQQMSAADQQFTQRCNAVASEGQSKFGQHAFTHVVGQLQKAGVMERSFLEAVTEFEDAPAILHHLGQDANLGEAMRIKDLSPVAMAAALAKLSTRLGAPQAARPASNAPPPVTRVTGNGSAPPPSFDDPNLPMEEWMKIRDKQAEERRRH